MRTPTARKPRASSQARIDTLLCAARSLLAEHGIGALSMYAVAERAGIPPSSVYHFFPGVPAILEALTAKVHAAFRACLETPLEGPPPASWPALARLIEQRMLAVYAADPAARQLILTQHGLAEVVQADARHDTELGALMRALFARHFQLPPLPTDVDVFALAFELGDRVYARSMQLHGEITPRLAEEGMRVFEAYLSLYLPPCLPHAAD